MMELNHDCPKFPWMVEFYSTDQGKILNGQLKAAFADTTMEYLSALSVKSKAPSHKATQLICTIPRNLSVFTLEELLFNGLSVAKIMSADNSKEQIIQLISKIKAVCDQFSRRIGRHYPLAIALEIKGPEIRIGNLIDADSTLFLPQGKSVTLTTDYTFANKVTPDLIYVDYEKLPDIVQPGDRVILGNGTVRLSAIEAAESIIRCIVERAGKIISKDSVTIPNVPIEMPTVCAETRELIDLAMDCNVDFIFVASICNRDSLYEMRKLIGTPAEKLSIIAKIDNIHALETIDEIIQEADGICIDTDKLVWELPKQKLFLVQKSVIAKCNLQGKPVIACISICNMTTIDKAQVCDIANAIIDGVDALMIPQEGCTKEIIRDLCLVCKEAEPAVHHKILFRDLVNHVVTPNEAIYSLCISAVESSLKSNAAAIICLSTSGRTAKILSMFRPRCPIITVTKYDRVAKSLRIYKGVDPVVYLKPNTTNWNKDVEYRIQLGVTFGKQMDYIKMGDLIVLITGSNSQSGKPDCIKIVYASDYDTIFSKTKYQRY